MTEEQKKKIKALTESLDKEFGKGFSKRIGDEAGITRIKRWNVDSPYLMDILGGGLPKSRMIELYGMEASGKSTLSAYFCGQVQQQGGTVAYVDMEHAFDPEYFSKFMNVEDAIFFQPDSGEQALQTVEKMVKSGAISLIVVDSVASLVPKAEIDGDIGDAHMALQARMMSQACRKLNPLLDGVSTSIIFVNQLRDNIGGYGNPSITPAGKALKFYSSIRLEVKRRENIMKSNAIAGFYIRVKAVKNKTAVPFKFRELKFTFNEGFDVGNEYIDMAIYHNIIKKSGAWLTFDDSFGIDKKFHGQNMVIDYLDANPEVFETVKKMLSDVIFVSSSNDVDEKKVKKSIDAALDEDSDDEDSISDDAGEFDFE